MTYKAIAFYRDSVSSALANYDLIVGTEEEAQFQAGIQLNRINKVSARLTPNYTDGFLFLKLERGLGGWDYWKHMHGDERQIDFSSVEAKELYELAEVSHDVQSTTRRLEKITQSDREGIEKLLSELLPSHLNMRAIEETIS